MYKQKNTYSVFCILGYLGTLQHVAAISCNFPHDLYQYPWSLLVFYRFVKQIEALGKSVRNQWEVAPYLLDNLLTMNLQPTTVTVNAAMTGYMVVQVEAGFYFIGFILPFFFGGGWGVKRGIYTKKKDF